MSLKKLFIKNTLLNMGGYAYLLLASFIAIPILIKNLGQTQYGIYILFGSLAPLLSTFDLGLSQAAIRYLSLPGSKTENRIKIWLTTMTGFLFLAAAISLAGFLFLTLYGPHMTAFADLPSNLLFALALVASGIVFFNHLNVGLLTLPQADQRFDIYNTRTLLVGTGNTFAVAILSYFYPHPLPLFLLQFSLHLLTFFSLLTYAFGSLPGLKFRFMIDRPYGRQLINFGLRQFIGNLANQINYQTSKYLIGARLPAQSVTAFSVPQNITVKGAGAVSQLTLAIFPLGTSLSTKERLPKLKKLILGLEGLTVLIGAAALVLVYTVGQPVLAWWLGNPELAAAAIPILKILTWFFFITILTPIPSVVSESLNYPHVPAFFATLTTILNLSLLVFLLPRFGLLGAAFAYLISVAIITPPFLITFIVLLRRFEKRL